MPSYFRKPTCLGIVLIFLFPILSKAHQPDQSYIYLRMFDQSTEGTFQINYKNINELLGTNFTDSAKLADLAPYLPQIQTYILEHSSFSANGSPLHIEFIDPTIFPAPDAGTFLLQHFEFDEIQEAPDAMDITFNFFYEQNQSHSNWLMIESSWKAGVFNNERIPSLIFDQGRGMQTLDLSNFTLFRGFMLFIYQGMKHIWIGFDHILFLLALLLPSVITRNGVGEENNFGKQLGENHFLTKIAPQMPDWAPLQAFRPALWNVIKVVTFFTIAHSITLSVASLGIVQLPSRMVESIIALSIALAAYHNFRPLFSQREWLIVFGFGLFHGFGFASVLGDLGVTGEYMLLTLLGFNLGVEVGQIVIIILIFPFLFWLRNSKLYPYLLTIGSILLVLVSLYWFAGRAFDFEVYGEDTTAYIYRKIERFFVNNFI
ncbi:MAG: HupE/UreJ family protein [Bacteroidota bacterium]